MLYRAYMNGKEINDFIVGGKRTDGLYGGNTILWRRNAIHKLTDFNYVRSFGSSDRTSGFETDYMESKVNVYGVLLSGSIDVYCRIDQNNNAHMAIAAFERKNDDLSISYNIFFGGRITKGCVAETYERLLGAKKIDGSYESVNMNKKSILKIEPGIYSIGGKYENKLEVKSKTGQYIAGMFPYSNYAYGGPLGFKEFGNAEECITYIRKII